MERYTPLGVEENEMRKRTLALVGVMLLSATLLAGLGVGMAWLVSSFGNQASGGMMGMNGGMMGNGTAIVTSPSVLRQRVVEIASDIQVDPTTNQMRYTTQQVTLVMVGAPPGTPDMSWQVDGRVNPTLVIPAGGSVTVIFANGDADASHGWELTTAAPPYAVMPMMSAPVAASGAVVMPVSHAQGDRWYGASLTFSAPPPGTYYYLCPVPGHAEEGMWGRLMVESFGGARSPATA